MKYVEKSVGEACSQAIREIESKGFLAGEENIGLFFKEKKNPGLIPATAVAVSLVERSH